MTRRKGYKNRLPTVLPPAPRPKPLAEQRVARRAPPAPRQPERAPEVEAEVAPEPEVGAAPEPPPPPPGRAPTPAPRSRRRWVVPLLAALLVLLLGTAGLYFWLQDRDAATPEQATASLEAAGLANVPAAAPAQGSYAESVVRSDGIVEVRHWIRSDEPIKRLVLALPRVPGFVDLAAANVAVLADGEPVVGPAIAGGHVAYAIDPTTDLRLAYVITSAVERSDSVPGRALAAATNLTVRTTPRPGRDVRVVRAPQVLSLACAPSLYAVPAPCGTRVRADEWRVELDRDESAVRVVAQVMLDAG